MAFLHLICFLSVAILASSPLAVGQRPYYKPGKYACDQLAGILIYDTELIIKKVWKVYYAWNSDLGDRCVEMGFLNVTQELVNQVHNDMSEYLETQPYWEAATLMGWRGNGPDSHYRVLLFADQGPAGRFVGVNDVIRDDNIPPVKKSVPLYKILMRVTKDGQYLIIMDCDSGTTILCAEQDPSLHQEKIRAIAISLDIGDGVPACSSDFKEVPDNTEFVGPRFKW